MKNRKSVISTVVLDVDGTLTDSGIYYDESGNEIKKFSTKDAAGIFAAQALGIDVIVITGRESKATAKRMADLNVTKVFQNVKNKYAFLESFIKENGISKEGILYIGDDLNDLLPMQLAGIKACPCDSCKEILEIADYVSPVRGGFGAARDIIEHYLRSESLWDYAVAAAYGAGV